MRQDVVGSRPGCVRKSTLYEMTEFGRGDESMNAVGYTLVFGTVGAYISLLTLWLFAENCWSKRVRITLGLLAILTAVPVTALIAAGVTQRGHQILTYETRGNLLENARAFREEGEALKTKTEKTEPATGHAP